MKRIYLAVLSLVFAAQAPAQQVRLQASQQVQQPTQAQGQAVTQQVQQANQQYVEIARPNMDDVRPPVAITKDIVERLVEDRRARTLTPKQIEGVRESVDAARQAAVSPYPRGMIAEPRSRRIVFRPEVPQAGRKPEVIEMWQGTLSTMVFTDMNGNPWNVKAVSFDCSIFDDGRSCEGGDMGGKGGTADPTNMVSLRAVTPYSYGNIVVRLDGLATPVIFVLRTGKSKVTDMELSVQVEGRNPSAPPVAVSMQGLPGFDERMGDFLSGLPPEGATRMKVAGASAEAWMFNGAMYVRTRLSLLSPAFTDRVGSAEGIVVYKYPRFVPALLATINGAPTTLIVSGN
ncbi:DotH/IcmK family type IV secretion protein [Ralstonia sp. ASV6]|uniref:DotH/IcmK family type IV secretion protein n=1 Tax=Ralstonia sp. ASV6 TaxID=2795124 RepID=UPI0018EA4039|nr:DotH/IcmK family type IV secretion protein [Ralstonia sp. ASV6]